MPKISVEAKEMIDNLEKLNEFNQDEINKLRREIAVMEGRVKAYNDVIETFTKNRRDW